jgi:exopolysaccharide/PEP-CTERM locus tyrosine autokinase
MIKFSDTLKKSKKLIGLPDSTSEYSKDLPKDQMVQDICVLDRAGNKKDATNVSHNLVAHLEPQSFEAEQFRSLRTDLLFPATGESPRTIMTTSVNPQEGKTFVAANLAVSIAQNINEHVLLMDCDLRKPSIHRQFGFNGIPGLSEYLNNGASLPSLLLKTCVKKLTILPGGKAVSNPAEILSSRKMTKLLEEVKSRYPDRYIIIDSPPPKLTSEAKALARQVDGILLVIKYGSTRLELIEDLINILGKGKILGAVINHFDMRSSAYYYRYSKKRYYYGDHYTKSTRK